MTCPVCGKSVMSSVNGTCGKKECMEKLCKRCKNALTDKKYCTSCQAAIGRYDENTYSPWTPSTPIEGSSMDRFYASAYAPYVSTTYKDKGIFTDRCDDCTHAPRARAHPTYKDKSTSISQPICVRCGGVSEIGYIECAVCSVYNSTREKTPIQINITINNGHPATNPRGYPNQQSNSGNLNFYPEGRRLFPFLELKQ